MEHQKQQCKIVIVGWGTVGQALYHHIQHSSGKTQSHEQKEIQVIGIVARSGLKGVEVNEQIQVLSSAKELITSSLIDQADVIVELIGGLDDALEIAKQTLTRNSHLVTANKAMIAQHGTQLLDLAKAHSKLVQFEASTGGGIPIIHTLSERLSHDILHSVTGILNGTTNFILTRMELGDSLQQAIELAQKAGYAEADPSLDIDGSDPMQKLTILSRIAFGTPLRVDAISYEGLPENLSQLDFDFAQQNGWVIKSLAMASTTNPEAGEASPIEGRVHLALIDKDQFLASVKNEYNGIEVTGAFLQDAVFIGPGAGGKPTSHAVLSDIQAIANDAAKALPKAQERSLVGMSQERAFDRYVRLELNDQPGVFSQVCTIFGQLNININAVLQQPSSDGQGKRAFFTLEPSTEEVFSKAWEALNNNPHLRAKPLTLRVVKLDRSTD